jgi:mono/diheme cytochrome c family protein
MRISRFLASCVLLGAALVLGMQTRSLSASSAPASSDKKDNAARPQPTGDGDRAFRQNCSRCHQAPEGFPPQISGTIVRHMRVRASLSREDERAILKFLNP